MRFRSYAFLYDGSGYELEVRQDLERDIEIDKVMIRVMVHVEESIGTVNVVWHRAIRASFSSNIKSPETILSCQRASSQGPCYAGVWQLDARDRCPIIGVLLKAFLGKSAQ